MPSLSITNSTFEKCRQAGVAAIEDATFRFENFANNTFSGSDVGMWLTAGVVGSVSSAQSFSEIGSNASRRRGRR